eukprot:CAMPEP_0184524374 /NCGR_PEP_ID=MMETSP0198_2-20121128/9473_1 /TAXON_ID=1112570 /ORGANISM="Thraustochytrium sp., Strain LLF1b" /LENGTH=642 /DNA_ID=CAMNT_0026915647 /DNA_START=55 /DNA_END=1983 /DNA_ORIENTATION=+
MTANDADATEVAEDAATPEVVLSDLPVRHLDVLETVKNAQQGNGLRHRDYQRYREYCGRRLRRLRKGADCTLAGKSRKFEQQEPTAVQARQDERQLLIPLVNAERAWGYAMQLKDETQRDGDLRKRVHLVKRLSKAVKWAAVFSSLCAEACDDHTALEAEAYLAWMTGNMLLEKEEWQNAYLNFEKARGVYDQMAQVASPEARDLFLEKVSEIEPSLRYCSYNLARESGPGASQEEAIKLLKSKGAGDLLQAKLRKVLDAARQGESETASKLVWKGREVVVRSKDVRLKLLEVRDQRAALSKTEEEATATGNNASEDDDMQDGSGSSLEGAYLELLSVLDETKSTIKTEHTRMIKAATGTTIEKMNSEVADLTAYVKAVKIQISMERTARLAQSLEQTCKGLHNSSSGKELKHEPQEVVNMYDRVMGNIEDLRALFADGGSPPDSWETPHPDDLTPQKLAQVEFLHGAARTTQIAAWYALAAKWSPALALFDLALSKVEQGLSLSPAAALHEQLKELEKKVRASKCLALAESFKSRFTTTSKVETSESNGTARLHVAELPPAIEPVPGHPVVFDLAFTSLDVPKLGKKATASNSSSKTKTNSSVSKESAASDKKSSESATQQVTKKSSGWLSSVGGWLGGKK